jgi:GTPase
MATQTWDEEDMNFTLEQSSIMATADGIQTFAEPTALKTTNEIEDQQSDAIRQYVSKKTAWISPNEEQFDALVKFLKKRLDEGHGETILEIGTGATDGESPGLLVDEMEASVATLKSMQAVLDSEVQLLREKSLANNTRCINEYLIRRHIDQEDFMEVRVAVTGNVDAGKSTLLGVLTHGVLDDGRGVARQKHFRHKH